jgi:hypothetical protein
LVVHHLEAGIQSTIETSLENHGSSARLFRPAKCSARRLLEFRTPLVLAFCVLCITVITQVPGGVCCFAQEDLISEDGPLIDQQPFDLIYLNAEAGGETVKVFPISLPNRQLPASPSPNDKIEVILKQFPDRRYEIAWKWIDRIDLYEQMILDEAKQKLAAKDFSGAFQNLSFLMRNFPETSRLESLRLEFLYSSLTTTYGNSQLEQTLSTLEELRRTAPQFRTESVGRALNNVVRALIDRHEKAGDLASAKKLADRLEKTHGAIEPINQWRERMARMADARLEDSEKFLKEKRYRDAFSSALASLSLSPDNEAAKIFLRDLNSFYPILRVGVMQRSDLIDSTSLIDWAARRSGMLGDRPIFRFVKTGNEGGTYEFAFGRHRISDDRRSLQLSLNTKSLNAEDANLFADLILRRANPSDAIYDPEWAVIFDSVEMRSTNLLSVNLRRPHVLPHALMQWQTSDASSNFNLSGPYDRTFHDSSESVFSLRNEWKGSGLPSEIIEIFYSDSRKAVNDLNRGELDLIDQLYPSDARSLSGSQQFRVYSYSLPSTHLLVPISEHAYLSKDKFRRALLYAADRDGILRGELLNSDDMRDGQLISGPFPIGQADSDPLSYAYDKAIQPLPYDPQLAKLLINICKQEFEVLAEKSGETPPKLEKIFVGYPDFELARVAAQAMVEQWAMVGVEAELVQIASWNRNELIEKCDMVYLMTTLWEPATDIQRLLGNGGIAVSDNPFIVQSLDHLREALNWREVRNSLRDLHRLTAYHLPVLPLWQVTDRFVVRSGIGGVSDRPVSLYQNLNSWKLELDPTFSN